MVLKVKQISINYNLCLVTDKYLFKVKLFDDRHKPQSNNICMRLASCVQTYATINKVRTICLFSF